MSEEELILGIQSVFETTFSGKLAFSEDVRREDQVAWDSLHHVVLMINLEGKFGVRFNGETASKMTSASRIAEFLRSSNPK
ncbi:hypothetical protein LBMAG01_10680 [Acidobacteriota bacterium]|nr:hypothetical protein LBMAG01_10680 [Acidobacteriota bacterium]